MPLWLQAFLENEWTITCQPYMGISSSLTFWKGETMIYNFHVEQIFIWSFFGHVILWSKTFHFWKLPLQVTFYFWQFLSWLYFLHSWALTCQMKLVSTWMKCIQLSPTSKSIKSSTVDHSWLFQLIDEFGNALINLSPNPLMKWLKDETLASISSIQSWNGPHIHYRPHLLAMPWLAQCNWLGLTSGQNPNLKEYAPTLDDDKPWWWWCITSIKM